MDRGSDSFAATERFQRDFGDEAVLVLVKGELTRTVLTADLGRVLALEGCLSGNVPDNERGLGSLPAGVPRAGRAQAGEGRLRPGHLHQHGREPDQDELVARQRRAGPAPVGRRGGPGALPPARRPAGRAAAAGAGGRRGGQRGVHARPAGPGAALRAEPSAPSIDNPEFVSTLVFDSAAGAAGVPKSRFAYLFPRRLGADPGPAAARPQRRRAPARDRPGRAGRGREGLPARARGRATW